MANYPNSCATMDRDQGQLSVDKNSLKMIVAPDTSSVNALALPYVAIAFSQFLAHKKSQPASPHFLAPTEFHVFSVTVDQRDHHHFLPPQDMIGSDKFSCASHSSAFVNLLHYVLQAADLPASTNLHIDFSPDTGRLNIMVVSPYYSMESFALLIDRAIRDLAARDERIEQTVEDFDRKTMPLYHQTLVSADGHQATTLLQYVGKDNYAAPTMVVRLAHPEAMDAREIITRFKIQTVVTLGLPLPMDAEPINIPRVTARAWVQVHTMDRVANKAVVGPKESLASRPNLGLFLSDLLGVDEVDLPDEYVRPMSGLSESKAPSFEVKFDDMELVLRKLTIHAAAIKSLTANKEGMTGPKTTRQKKTGRFPAAGRGRGRMFSTMAQPNILPDVKHHRFRVFDALGGGGRDNNIGNVATQALPADGFPHGPRPTGPALRPRFPGALTAAGRQLGGLFRRFVK